jgi:hypothetical protein
LFVEQFHFYNNNTTLYGLTCGYSQTLPAEKDLLSRTRALLMHWTTKGYVRLVEPNKSKEFNAGHFANTLGVGDRVTVYSNILQGSDASRIICITKSQHTVHAKPSQCLQVHVLLHEVSR